MEKKFAVDLVPSDLERVPVWRLSDDDFDEDSCVIAEERWPVKTGGSRVFGVQVRLANGSHVWAALGNVDGRNATMMRHFLAVSVWADGEWFHLARYHDVTADQFGPAALAAKLGLRLDAVFPIEFDLRPLLQGENPEARGTVEAVPAERLSNEELLRLVIESTRGGDDGE
jgi:hypothetical protein